MSNKEKKLLEIAKETIELNQHLCAKLTGSLMLAVMGLNKRRESSDIDIICDYLSEDRNGYPFVPKGFKTCGMYGGGSEVDAIQFINDEGIKIEFMCSEEELNIIEGIKCGELNMLIEAKKRYVKNDKNDFSREKHELDLEYLYKNNKL